MNDLQKREIPIFFSVDDNYVPFLDVTIRSIISHSSPENFYHVIVLNTGIDSAKTEIVKKQEQENVSIEFVDISSHIAKIKSKLKDVYHYSLATYYRLFIPSLFPQYDRIIYLDSDVVVLCDLAELYNIDLKRNVLAGVTDQFVTACEEFRTYTKSTLGVRAESYINAGILLIDLAKFRSNKIEEKFLYLLNRYNFDSVAPDQDYINFLCKGKILHLPSKWNKMPLPSAEGSTIKIMHYNLYKKPWQYDDVVNGQFFWKYAASSPFYSQILDVKNAFDEDEKAKKDASGIQIKQQALQIASSHDTMYKKIAEKPSKILRAKGRIWKSQSRG